MPGRHSPSIHHAAVVEWLRESQGDQLLFCRVTQQGLLRFVTNPRGLPILTFDGTSRAMGVNTPGFSRLLNIQNLFLFRFRSRIDLRHLSIGHLLDFVQSPALVVFANRLVFEQFLQVLVGVAPDVA